MPTVYLHIGAHKTGTTAIQYFLWNNRESLKSQGYLYPDFYLSPFSHGELANIIKPNNRDARLVDCQNQLKEQVLDSGYRNIIFSSEVFLEGENIAEAARDFFPKAHCDVKVILYLRNQVDWLESVFHEIVRDPYRRYTGDLSGMREYRQGLQDYRRLLEPWLKHFGASSIELCPYETAKAEGGILHHLLALLGVEEKDSFDFNVSEGNQNLRLHPLASEFLRRVNRYPMLNSEHRSLVGALQNASAGIDRKFDRNFRLLDAETASVLVNEFSGQNRDLFAQFSRYEPTSLFEGYQAAVEARHTADEFGPEVQHAIVDALCPSSRSLLEDLVPAVANRETGKIFLRPPGCNREERLDEVIFRQRFELRRLYQEYVDKG